MWPVIFWVVIGLLFVCMGVNLVVTGSRVYQRVERSSEYMLISAVERIDDAKLAIVRAEGEVGALDRYSSGINGSTDEYQGIGRVQIKDMQEAVRQECAEVRQSLEGISPNGRGSAESSGLVRRRMVMGFCVDFLIVLLAVMFVPWLG